jgi:hypothetical protein
MAFMSRRCRCLLARTVFHIVFGAAPSFQSLTAFLQTAAGVLVRCPKKSIMVKAWFVSHVATRICRRVEFFLGPSAFLLRALGIDYTVAKLNKYGRFNRYNF